MVYRRTIHIQLYSVDQSEPPVAVPYLARHALLLLWVELPQPRCVVGAISKVRFKLKAIFSFSQVEVLKPRAFKPGSSLHRPTQGVGVLDVGVQVDI